MLKRIKSFFSNFDSRKTIDDLDTLAWILTRPTGKNPELRALLDTLLMHCAENIDAHWARNTIAVFFTCPPYKAPLFLKMFAEGEIALDMKACRTILAEISARGARESVKEFNRKSYVNNLLVGSTYWAYPNKAVAAASRGLRPGAREYHISPEWERDRLGRATHDFDKG